MQVSPPWEFPGRVPAGIKAAAGRCGVQSRAEPGPTAPASAASPNHEPPPELRPPQPPAAAAAGSLRLAGPGGPHDRRAAVPVRGDCERGDPPQAHRPRGADPRGAPLRGAGSHSHHQARQENVSGAHRALGQADRQQDPEQ